MKRLLLIALAAVVVLAACYWIASATRDEGLEAKQMAREAARAREAEKEKKSEEMKLEITRKAEIALRRAELAERRRAREEREAEEARARSREILKQEEESRRIAKEIAADLKRDSRAMTLNVRANRADGLVVNEEPGGEMLYFVHHTKRTRNAAVGDEIKVRGMVRDFGYRTNEITVLKVITIVE